MTDSAQILPIVSQLRSLCADFDNHDYILGESSIVGGLMTFVVNADPKVATIAAQAIKFLTENSANIPRLKQKKKFLKIVQEQCTRDVETVSKLMKSAAKKLGLVIEEEKPQTPEFDPLALMTGAAAPSNALFDSMFGSTTDGTDASPSTPAVEDVPPTAGGDVSTPLAESDNTLKNNNTTVYIKINGINNERDRLLVEKQLLSIPQVISVTLDSVSKTAVIFGSAETTFICQAINKPSEYAQVMAETHPEVKTVREQDLVGFSASQMFNEGGAFEGENINHYENSAVNTIVEDASLQSRLRRKKMEKKKQQQTSNILGVFARALWSW